MPINAGDIRHAGQEDLEDGTATQSNVLAWKIPWTEKTGRLHSWGHRVGHDLATKQKQENRVIYNLKISIIG